MTINVQVANNCLFVWSFSCHSRIFHSFGDVIIAGEGLQILNYARHSRPLSSEGSLARHTYCDTSVYNAHVRGPMTLNLMPNVWQ